MNISHEFNILREELSDLCPIYALNSTVLRALPPAGQPCYLDKETLLLRNGLRQHVAETRLGSVQDWFKVQSIGSSLLTRPCLLFLYIFELTQCTFLLRDFPFKSQCHAVSVNSVGWVTKDAHRTPLSFRNTLSCALLWLLPSCLRKY